MRENGNDGQLFGSLGNCACLRWAASPARAEARHGTPRLTPRSITRETCKPIGQSPFSSTANSRRLNRLFRPGDDLHPPLHPRLALLDTKPSIDNGKLQDRAGQVTAAGLRAVWKARLVDVEAGIKWLDRNQQIYCLDRARQLATKIDQSIPGVTGKCYQRERQDHVVSLLENRRR